MTLAELWAYIRDGGMMALLFLIILGGWKRYWVFGWYADEQRERIRDLEERLERADEKIERAERAAVSGTALARRGLSMAERGLSDRAGAADG